ncbi:hypothetical protein DXB64_03505 [Bacteroides uniformis]|nr:hypothetical protein DXB64_03505 [Bacteroides uniformis]RGN47855.1 hypothetical protein DXB62_06025 [Bacteroides uniformis]
MNNVMDLIIRCAEADGWSVDTEINHERQETEFTFSKYTPAGQDFSFPVTMQDDDLNSLIGSIKEYYDNFDVDEEAYLWLDETGHGKNGAPYRMKDVVKDMEEAEKMIDRLLDAILKLEQSF